VIRIIQQSSHFNNFIIRRLPESSALDDDAQIALCALDTPGSGHAHCIGPHYHFFLLGLSLGVIKTRADKKAPCALHDQHHKKLIPALFILPA
jgi:hypothetical protein